MQGASHVLETELKTYDEHRAELLGSAEGKYVLIHDREIAGIYDAKMDAINDGYRKYGSVAFLVKQILRIEVPEDFTSHTLIWSP
jgi:hypothetical protein